MFVMFYRLCFHRHAWEHSDLWVDLTSDFFKHLKACASAHVMLPKMFSTDLQNVPQKIWGTGGNSKKMSPKWRFRNTIPCSRNNWTFSGTLFLFLLPWNIFKNTFPSSRNYWKFSGTRVHVPVPQYFPGTREHVPQILGNMLRWINILHNYYSTKVSSS